MKKSIFIITALCSHILAVAQLDTASFNDNLLEYGKNLRIHTLNLLPLQI
jgi:hypothetical protein